MFTDFPDSDILLTPHIYSPIPADGKKPDEQSFLIFGIYNLGFISIRKSEESFKLLSWWKIRTYESGNMDTYKGNYTDQLPMNLVPVFFKRVGILRDYGMNMAPWNLHERSLSFLHGEIYVNGQGPLKFFHFSSVMPGKPELPLHYYNRFQLEQRPDLQKIYQEYHLELLEAGHAKFRVLPNAYAEKRKSIPAE